MRGLVLVVGLPFLAPILGLTSKFLAPVLGLTKSFLVLTANTVKVSHLFGHFLTYLREFLTYLGQ